MTSVTLAGNWRGRFAARVIWAHRTRSPAYSIPSFLQAWAYAGSFALPVRSHYFRHPSYCLGLRPRALRHPSEGWTIVGVFTFRCVCLFRHAV